MMSNGRLEVIAKNALSEERRLMASELLALRILIDKAYNAAYTEESMHFISQAVNNLDAWIGRTE